MSNTQKCVCWHRNRHVLVSFLFLLVSILTHNRISMVEGRAISKLLLEAAQKGIRVEEEKMVVRRGGKIIGSRPPRCERRCRAWACGHCEAVQVPVVPQKLVSRSRSSTSTNFSFSSLSEFKQVLCSAKTTRSTPRAKNNDNYHLVADSRTDDFSNYKPMSWKCKCGDFLFNP